MPHGTNEIDPAHSSVQFTVRHMLLSNVRGEFTIVSGTINFNFANPARSTLEAKIDATSITTQDSQRNALLKNADLLDVDSFPDLVFRGTKVAQQSGGGKVTSDLTKHGVTREVTLDVEGSAQEAKDPWGKRRAGAPANSNSMSTRSHPPDECRAAHSVRSTACRGPVPAIGRCQPRKMAITLSQKQRSAPAIMNAKDG